MKTRASARREQEDEPASPPTTPSPSTNRRSSSNRALRPMHSVADGAAAINGSGPPTVTASARKRTSPNTGTSRHSDHQQSGAASAAASAVSSAAAAKQRRISGRSLLDSASSSAPTVSSGLPGPLHVSVPDHSAQADGASSRELKYLTDYYPNQQVDDSRRLTRSQIRAAPSPNQATLSSPRLDSRNDREKNRAVASPNTSHNRTRGAGSGSGKKSAAARRGQDTAGDAAHDAEQSAASHSNNTRRAKHPMLFGGSDRHRLHPADGGASSSSLAPPPQPNAASGRQTISGRAMQWDQLEMHIGPDAFLTVGDGPAIGARQPVSASIAMLNAGLQSARNVHQISVIQHGSGVVGSSSPARVDANTVGDNLTTGGSAANSRGVSIAVDQQSVAAAVGQHTQHLQLASTMLLESMAQAQAVAGGGTTTAHRSGGARSAASAFIGNLVPRMQHLLGGATHREHHSNNARVSAILEGLRSTNEIRQAEAATELAELLLMGNEDSLPQNLPIREIVSLVVVLLQKEHNFELMLTAARCLTNLLEALPRAQPIVIDAVPFLLEKLKRIECIDVAEQSLAALEVMSRRNGKNIMASGGIAATISHIDFFPLASQRLAFSIAANCALYVSHADFHLVRDSLAELTQRLLNEDKRCLDSICTLFARLVDNMRSHPDKLREVAGANHCLLANMQQLLLSQPSLLSSTTFPLVVKTLRILATRCSDVAVALVHMGFAHTLRFLFVGPSGMDSDDAPVDLVSRPANQLAELVYLTGELFPRLPATGIFEIDAVVAQTRPNIDGAATAATAQWYWRDEEGWQPFRNQESRILEIAKTNGERELHVSIGQHVYQMDVIGMRQTNTVTGTARELRRAVYSPVKRDTPSSSQEPPKTTASEEDRRLALLQSDGVRMETVCRQLFPVLVEIDGSSSGPALRYESLRVMLRMVCPMSSGVLRAVLADLPLSGHIASALASPRSKDLCVVVAALQLVHLLLEKLSDVYGPLFRKEGVAHEVAKLAALCVQSTSTPTVNSTQNSSPSSKSAPPSGVASPALGSSSPANTDNSSAGSAIASRTRRTVERAAKRAQAAEASTSSPSPSASTARDDGSPSSAGGPSTSAATPTAPLTRNRHRKRASPESSPSSGNKEKSRRKSSSSAFLSALRLPSFRASPSSSTSSATASPPLGAPSSGPPPPTYQQAMAASVYYQPPNTISSSSGGSSSAAAAASRVRAFAAAAAAAVSGNGTASQLTNQQKEKLRGWIKKEAELLMKTYLGDGVTMSSGGGTAIDALSAAAKALEKKSTDCGESALLKLYGILEKENVSAFELKHSGALSALHTYLTSETLNQDRKGRLRRFAKVFMKLEPSNLRPTGIDGCFSIFEGLVQKVLVSVSLLEQFQVKVSDMGGIATGGAAGCLRGAQALRFFQSHQIRCNLRRHPSCRELVEWRHGHGSIKVDPLTSISAIERYLMDRGIGYVRTASGGSGGVGGVVDESSGEDELSDEDTEGISASGSGQPPNGEERRIEILIGDSAVQSGMSVLQALRQYSPALQDEASSGGAVGQSLWMSTHTLYYRSAAPVADGSNSQSASSTPNQAGPSSIATSPGQPLPVQAKDKKHKVPEKLWIDGEMDPTESPLWSYLSDRLPSELDDPSVPSLLLLRALYGLNKYWHALFEDDEVLPTTFNPILPGSAFVSAKLAAKLHRQLSDFLSVATQQIPKWTVDVARATPFLFPFTLRRSLLYCTAFGRDRALMHLVSQTDNGGAVDSTESGRGLTPRLERKKVSIKRDELLKSVEAALLACAGQRAMLEVSFEGEAGTGFGPTLEFYSSISKELQLASLKLWSGGVVRSIGEDGQPGAEYVSAPHGLHPAAVAHGQKGNTGGGSSRVKKFELIGRLLAQSLIDARILDLPLSPLFLSWLTGEQHKLALPDLEVLDPMLYSSLRQVTLTAPEDFEHLEQYFTLPGNEQFELVKGGKHKVVNKDNAMQFAKLVARWRLREGVAREMEAVRRGFCSIVDSSHLSIFTHDELDQLFCGCPDNAGDKIWSEQALAAAIKPDHGYSHDSDHIKWLLRMLASFDKDEQRRFVQFVTGSPRLPVGGFRSLNPPLTVVRKSSAYNSSNEELPSAMTCYNYLKVPPYSSYEVFRERFSVALRFVTSFHLT